MHQFGKILVSVAGLLLAGNPAHAEINVVDDGGRTITLSSPAERIVSLAPHITENLFTAGAGSLIVGTVEYSDFPKQALDIPRVGNYKRISLETVLALKPDLVVAWSSGNPEEMSTRMEALGLPVFYTNPTRFETIISNIERFGQLTGHVSTAEQAASQMRALLEELRHNYAHKTPVRVFYQVWDQPLMTLNGEHAVSRALETCAGVNVFAAEPTIAPRINIEGVLNANPQLILLAGHDNAQASGWLEKWQHWPAIDAVSKKQIHYLNPDIINRPTRRFLEGTRKVCEIIDAVRKASSGE